MSRAHLRFTVGFVTLLSLVTEGHITGFAQDIVAREKSATAVAVTYAKAYNAAVAHAGLPEKGSVDDILKVAAFPFFPGQVTNLQGSGPPTWISPVVFKKDDELRKHFAPRLGNPRRPAPLPVEVQGVESYADYRKKYLEKEPDGKTDIQRPFVRKALREGCDAVVNARDGLIVHLVDKSGSTTGFLIRFEKEQGKVVGVLYEPYAEPGTFTAPKPAAAPLKGKWLAVKGARDGKPLAKEELASFKITIDLTGDGVPGCRTGWGDPFGGTGDWFHGHGCHFDLKASPKQVSIIRSIGIKATTYPGIFKLDGHQLIVCWNLQPWTSPDGPAMRPMPKEFAAPKGSGLTLLTFEKVKE